MPGISDAAHLCIDMQNIFARGGVWETPWMERVLPVISNICARYRERTVFTRFVTPEKPEDRRGQWQAYFTKWKRATRGDLLFIHRNASHESRLVTQLAPLRPSREAVAPTRPYDPRR